MRCVCGGFNPQNPELDTFPKVVEGALAKYLERASPEQHAKGGTRRLLKVLVRRSPPPPPVADVAFETAGGSRQNCLTCSRSEDTTKHSAQASAKQQPLNYRRSINRQQN